MVVCKVSVTGTCGAGSGKCNTKWFDKCFQRWQGERASCQVHAWGTWGRRLPTNMCIILISIKISHCSQAVQRGLSEGFLLCSTVLVSAEAGPRPRPTKQYTNNTICRLIWELIVLVDYDEMTATVKTKHTCLELSTCQLARVSPVWYDTCARLLSCLRYTMYIVFQYHSA